MGRFVDFSRKVKVYLAQWDSEVESFETVGKLWWQRKERKISFTNKAENLNF